jgi:hypothetical protein
MAKVNAAIEPSKKKEVPGTMEVDSQSGSGGRHRRDSVNVALRYGRFGRSVRVGIRSRPTTLSISAVTRA